MLPDARSFHLKAIAVADDPLRYIRKFLLIEEDLGGIPSIRDQEEEAAAEEWNIEMAEGTADDT